MWVSNAAQFFEELDSVQIVGRAILPAAGFQPALAAKKGGCGQDWPPHNLYRVTSIGKTTASP